MSYGYIAGGDSDAACTTPTSKHFTQTALVLEPFFAKREVKVVGVDSCA